MRTYDQLQTLWEASAPEIPRDRGTIRALSVRIDVGRNEAWDRVEVSLDQGVIGDRWSADDDPERERQVSIMNARVAELVCDTEHGLHIPGDNLVVDLDVSEAALPAGTRVRAGTVLLEVTTYPHLGCKKFRARFGDDALRWVNHKDHRDRRFRGLYCRVVQPGVISIGDSICVEP